MAADLTGAFLTCRGFMHHLAEKPRDEASIVLVASTAAGSWAAKPLRFSLVGFS